MKYLFERVYWWLYCVRLAARWVPQINLGDRVVFDGKTWTLIQGVCRPKWDLWDGNERIDGVDESLFRKARTPSNYLRSFVSGYRFYMNSWYAIWLDQGILPWMRACNIWPGKPKDETK